MKNLCSNLRRGTGLGLFISGNIIEAHGGKIWAENNQFIVTTFNDPLEALSKFRPRLYDLLILDIRMPGMNGFQLYRKIRDIDNKVKVCFLTAFDESRTEFKSSFPFLEEVRCYLKKPITVQNLVKRLADLANS